MINNKLFLFTSFCTILEIIHNFIRTLTLVNLYILLDLKITMAGSSLASLNSARVRLLLLLFVFFMPCCIVHDFNEI